VRDNWRGKKRNWSPDKVWEGKKIMVIIIRIIGHFTAFYCFVSGERINKDIFLETDPLRTLEDSSREL